MPYVVTENCIKCKYMDCVEVCPVDCFYDGENMLVMHDSEGGAFISESGIVVVTEATQERLQGLFFMIGFRNAFFSTDAFPLGTFRADHPVGIRSQRSCAR